MNVAELDIEVVREASPPPAAEELSTAETAECQCPDFCERDHDLD